MFPDARFPLATSNFLAGVMEDHDLRCFLLNTRGQSRARCLGAPGLGEGGTTFSSKGKTVSEIYLKELRGMGHLSDGITQKNATVMAQALFKKVARFPGP